MWFVGRLFHRVGNPDFDHLKDFKDGCESTLLPRAQRLWWRPSPFQTLNTKQDDFFSTHKRLSSLQTHSKNWTLDGELFEIQKKINGVTPCDSPLRNLQPQDSKNWSKAASAPVKWGCSHLAGTVGVSFHRAGFEAFGPAVQIHQCHGLKTTKTSKDAQILSPFHPSAHQVISSNKITTPSTIRGAILYNATKVASYISTSILATSISLSGRSSFKMFACRSWTERLQHCETVWMMPCSSVPPLPKRKGQRRLRSQKILKALHVLFRVGKDLCNNLKLSGEAHEGLSLDSGRPLPCVFLQVVRKTQFESTIHQWVCLGGYTAAWTRGLLPPKPQVYFAAWRVAKKEGNDSAARQDKAMEAGKQYLIIYKILKAVSILRWIIAHEINPMAQFFLKWHHAEWMHPSVNGSCRRVFQRIARFVGLETNGSGVLG